MQAPIFCVYFPVFARIPKDCGNGFVDALGCCRGSAKGGTAVVILECTTSWGETTRILTRRARVPRQLIWHPGNDGQRVRIPVVFRHSSRPAKESCLTFTNFFLTSRDHAKWLSENNFFMAKTTFL